ncbi:hypothetical protein [Antarctobacter sp.]|uniref:hypothetical protein n=1 Tax=Antarctobacter sp. TaxID=1872577 RepID=UPI003A8FABDC
MRLVWALGMVAALGGCMEGAAPVSGGAGGGQGAEARKLSTGMTQAQADAVFGLDAGFERNPANWDEACVSYAYGSAEAPRYVHAVFRNGQLVRSTDGHGAICAYGAAL